MAPTESAPDRILRLLLARGELPANELRTRANLSPRGFRVAIVALEKEGLVKFDATRHPKPRGYGRPANGVWRAEEGAGARVFLSRSVGLIGSGLTASLPGLGAIVSRPSPGSKDFLARLEKQAEGEEGRLRRLMRGTQDLIEEEWRHFVFERTPPAETAEATAYLERYHSFLKQNAPTREDKNSIAKNDALTGPYLSKAEGTPHHFCILMRRHELDRHAAGWLEGERIDEGRGERFLESGERDRMVKKAAKAWEKFLGTWSDCPKLVVVLGTPAELMDAYSIALQNRQRRDWPTFS